MSQQNVEGVRGMFEAFEARDLDRLVADADPEVEPRPGLVGGLEGTVYRGRDTQVAG